MSIGNEITEGEAFMHIRTATHADTDTLIALRFSFLREFRAIGQETEQALLPQLRQYFAKHLDTAGFVALLGFEGEEAACTAFLTVVEGPPTTNTPTGA